MISFPLLRSGKDKQIAMLQDDLDNATTKILQLEEELLQFRTTTSKVETPATPLVVSLNDLIDVKGFQDQIFATCAMTLFFTLILSKRLCEEGNDFPSSDLSISNVNCGMV